MTPQHRGTLSLSAPRLRKLTFAQIAEVFGDLPLMVPDDHYMESISFQNSSIKKKEVDTLFVNGDDFIISEIKDGRFFAENNHRDPDNPVSAEEAVQRLAEAMEEAQPNPDDPDELIIEVPEPPNTVTYGQYFDNAMDTLRAVKSWIGKSAAELPKCYTPPSDPVWPKRRK